MFWKNTKEESTEVARLTNELDEKVASYETLIDKINADHEKAISDINKDNDIVNKRKDAEVDVKVSAATKELTAKVAKLELENGTYKKEIEILTKAFENMGFDVKDMKEILNKLVDGIVSKNTVNVLKS